MKFYSVIYQAIEDVKSAMSRRFTTGWYLKATTTKSKRLGFLEGFKH